jgi:hypothetical protein
MIFHPRCAAEHGKFCTNMTGHKKSCNEPKGIRNQNARTIAAGGAVGRAAAPDEAHVSDVIVQHPAEQVMWQSRT